MRAEKISEVPIPDPSEFPLDDPDEITVTLRRSQIPELGADRPRVLLVDTDGKVRKMGVRLLGQECRVDTADSAESAWSLLSVSTYHVVITDHALRERDGIWLLRFVQRRHPTTRRVLYTEEDPSRFRNPVAAGLVQAVVPKPASRTELITSLSAEA